MRTLFCWLLVLGLATGAKVSAAPPTIDFPLDSEFLPRTWVDEPIGARIEPLDPALHDEAARIVERALDKYPGALLNRFLRGVHLVGALRFYDVNYGGTYLANGRRVVLVYRANFDRRGFEQRFHHELSSILLDQNESRFEEGRWRAANDPTFTYRAPGIIEEQSGDRSEATRVLAAEQKRTGGSGSSLLQIDTALMEDGFLTPYNRVSVEQDFNETAAHLFTNPELWRYCETYPRLDQKVDVLIDFYRTLDPGLDRLYFRRLTERPSATPEPAP